MNHANAGYLVVGGDGGINNNNNISGNQQESDLCVICGVATLNLTVVHPSGGSSGRSSYATSVLLPASKRTVSDRVTEILSSDGGDALPDVYQDTSVVCAKCYSLVSKVDSLELVLQGAKSQLRQLHSNRQQQAGLRQQQASLGQVGNGMNSAYGQITAIYDTGLLDYRNNKSGVKAGEGTSVSGDGSHFMMSQQHHQGQLQGSHQQQVTQQQHATTATGMRFIAAANAGFFTMNGIPQFSNAVPVSVSDGAAHQFLLNQQCLPISLAVAASAGDVGGGGRNGDAGGNAGGACFQVPLQRAFFRAAVAGASSNATTSPGPPSSSASVGHVDSSSPDGSISDFPVLAKAELHADSDSDVSGGNNFHQHVLVGGHSGQPVHPSNVGLMDAAGGYGSSAVAIKTEPGGDGSSGAPPKKRGSRKRGRGRGMGGGRGPNRNMNVPGAKYPCEVCGQPFKTKQGLSLHRWRLHRVRDKLLKLFPCEHCGKDFNAMSKLRDHKLIHTGEKPHACPYCEYRCALFGNLNHHIRKVHKSKPPLLSQAALAGTGTSLTPSLTGNESAGMEDESHSQRLSDMSPKEELDMDNESADDVDACAEDEEEDDDDLDADDVPSPRTMLGVPSLKHEDE